MKSIVLDYSSDTDRTNRLATEAEPEGRAAEAASFALHIAVGT